MRKTETNFRLLKARLAALEEKREMEPGQSLAARRAVSRMRHAVRVADRDDLVTAVNDLVRVFLRMELL